ncbi:J domain-containing protein [Hyalangium rubrum]|uniref:J domain-containing protein n=1 Tax=Hyalangium rubrum TaxID=3103134 RepID=A0ABU5GW18_9BACT|nr:J domain-containing protein [Hyalangium sp. s54d21]MDY7225039.1 J domain-containing protein [Hyalangium sp. s54d21]
MSACPCCLEVLKPALLGLGGRRLAGNCELCGDAVCQDCLHSGSPDVEALFQRRAPDGVPSPRASRRQACGSCLWESFEARGVAPSFPEPSGHRKRAAQAACAHLHAVRWMRCCPTCGVEMAWKAEHDNPMCDACGAPSHLEFNCCWACGESFEEENEATDTAEGYALDFDCRSRTCEGRVAWLMPYCPWCATAQRWQPSEEEDAPSCVGCEAKLDPTWTFCASCGEEAPLPEDCFTCGTALDEADCAARCEHCRRMVCGECFGDYTLPESRAGQGEAKEGSPGVRETLLCPPCAEELGASPLQDEEEEEEAPEPESRADEEEEGGDDPPAAQAAAPSSPWEVLGVAPGTPLTEVKRAYIALITQYHPDKVAQLGPKLQALAAEETRRLNQAWSELRQRGGQGPT